MQTSVLVRFSHVAHSTFRLRVCWLASLIRTAGQLSRASWPCCGLRSKCRLIRLPPFTKRAVYPFPILRYLHGWVRDRLQQPPPPNFASFLGEVTACPDRGAAFPGRPLVLTTFQLPYVWSHSRFQICGHRPFGRYHCEVDGFDDIFDVVRPLVQEPFPASRLIGHFHRVASNIGVAAYSMEPIGYRLRCWVSVLQDRVRVEARLRRPKHPSACAKPRGWGMGSASP